MTNFNWADLAFASNKPLKELQATFIAAPRELSLARFKQLVKTYLPKGNLVLGVSTQDYVDGFTGQPQFRTLRQAAVQAVIDQVDAASPQAKIHTLTYAPADEPHLIAKNLFARYVFINGSWSRSFHLRPAFYELTKLRAGYQLISPFTGEVEAHAYLDQIWPEIEAATPLPAPGTRLTATQALELAGTAARRSFDYTFQTGTVLARPAGRDTFEFITASWNAVVPHQTRALHEGSIREQRFSPAGDLNFYDTNHAEMALLIAAATQHLNLAGATMFINLLPCPTCARILAATPIAKFIYQHDHSDGYAYNYLQAAGKTIFRIAI
ncbi:MAG TPA: deaminase [Candidatus Saccharimonadia bacterium]